ncbi:hypothetical protein Tco_1485902 [Tanacetum coccineum]
MTKPPLKPCFIYDGSYWIRDCPSRKAINALVAEMNSITKEPPQRELGSIKHLGTIREILTKAKTKDQDLEEEPAPTGDQSGPSAPPAPKAAKQLAAKRNQERVKNILLLAIPDEYLLKFHNVADAKSLWEAIKSRFGGNIESKKMQKNVLKHQFENFSTASNESLDKDYDRF